MNTHNPPPESDPFQEPLTPLPAAADSPEGESPGAPESVEPRMVEEEPEKVLPPETELATESAEVELMQQQPRRPRWKFWKRANRREQELATLKQGAAEMVGLMRSIRDHLEAGQEEREGIRDTLSPLPVAVESLKSMSESHLQTGRVLGELKTTMERSTEKDELLLKSLNRIGDTISNVDGTFNKMDKTLTGFDQSNQRSVQTMDKLGERVEESDRFMEETFARLREAEREFTDYVSKSSRRGTFAMMSLCSILLVSVLAVGFMFKENRELLTAVQRNQGPLFVQVPMPEQEDDPMAIFEDLKQVDDGIGEPDREIVGESAQEVNPFTLDTTPESLLSVNELPRRE